MGRTVGQREVDNIRALEEDAGYASSRSWVKAVSSSGSGGGGSSSSSSSSRSAWRAKVKLSRSGLLALIASGIHTPYLTDYSLSFSPRCFLHLLTSSPQSSFPALDLSSSIVLFLCLNRIALFYFLLDHGVRPVRCSHDQPVAPYRPFCLLPSYYHYSCVEKKVMLTFVLSGTRVSLRGVGHPPSTTVVDSGRVARRRCIAATTTHPRASSGSGSSPATSAATSSPGSAAYSASSGALLSSPGTVCSSDKPVCQYHTEREGPGPGSAVS